MKIKRITFELHNFCSRKCIFCLKTKLKYNEFKFMEDEEFYKIIDKINENKELFEETIFIKIYGLQEPLYKSEILKNKINYIKTNLKIKSFITIISNGDFLNLETLNDIEGINELRINDYDDKGMKRILNFIKILNLKDLKLKKDFFNGTHPKEYINYYHKEKNFNIKFYLNTKKNFIISNLASEHNELLKNNNYNFLNKNTYIRKNKCEMIGNSLNFELNGDIKVCPSITNQLEKYKEYTKWNLNNYDLKEIIKEINLIEIPFFCLNCDNVGSECLY